VEEQDSAASLLMDGVPISSIERQILRQHLITVPQDPVFLYKGSTIAQNLDPTGLATPEQLAAVVKDLDLQDAVASQGGLERPLVETSLSQGQRQIFSLARAVLKRRITDRRVLLLDEFTSSVDVETERVMLDIVRKEFASCTVIMIAHRLDMVLDLCDRVLVMDQGAIVEDGAPRVLRQMDGTWFSALLRASDKQ
jgi:ABC-type multidrug transport system fused ATPase/permease subunit